MTRRDSSPTKKGTLSACLFLVAAIGGCTEESDLVQVHEDFSKDPGWEAKNNRIVAENPPTIKQDFGWAPTNHTGAGPGELGGRMWQSQTPAYYALPLNRPLSFDDKFSFSARVAFMPTGGAGVAYLGFFNHKLQGWRVWNSVAVRLGGESSGQAAIGADSMSAHWRATGATEGYLHVPADGKPHTIRFSYEPRAVRAPWPDPSLPKYIGEGRQSTEQILERARQYEPGLTRDELWQRLEDAHAEGLIYYIQRTGHESIIGGTSWNGYFWGLRPASDAEWGAMTLQLDGGRPFKEFVRKQPGEGSLYMDRFGLFNLQMYHQFIDLYLSELTVNGHKMDLSKDPGWEGRGNRVQFVEQDFQRQDYGYSETNWAGDDIGEVGGQFYRSEPVDPVTGYYADDVGKLTLDDPISFSGHVAFIKDSTDTGMYIGFFNSKDAMAELSPTRKLKTATSSLGVIVDGHAQHGKFFMPQVTSSQDTFAGANYGRSGPFPQATSEKKSTTDIIGGSPGFLFQPTKERHAFTFTYDPKANNNLGRVTVTLGDETVSLDLTAQQRAEGGVFDRFGVANLRSGGKYMTMYFDDLTYTARRAKGYQPVFHRQEVVKVHYPKGGRKY